MALTYLLLHSAAGAPVRASESLSTVFKRERLEKELAIRQEQGFTEDLSVPRPIEPYPLGLAYGSPLVSTRPTCSAAFLQGRFLPFLGRSTYTRREDGSWHGICHLDARSLSQQTTSQTLTCCTHLGRRLWCFLDYFWTRGDVTGMLKRDPRYVCVLLFSQEIFSFFLFDELDVFSLMTSKYVVNNVRPKSTNPPVPLFSCEFANRLPLVS